MAVQPEGVPCWADAMFGDLGGAKSFYGDLLGWSFSESSSEYGNYTQAYADGKAVAAVVPPMPGGEQTSSWCLYLASPDVKGTAEKVRAQGGEVLMGPTQVGEYGSMLLAKDPAGVVFGVWQAGTHEGFDAYGEPGAYCWAEIFTREPEKSDAFFTAVFPYRAQRMDDAEVDFKVYNIGDRPALGRMKMTEDMPPEVPPHIHVYFTVEDCDAAVAEATERGGKLRFGPMDTPFGRFAALTDPQNAAFSVIDVSTTTGEMPTFKEA